MILDEEEFNGKPLFRVGFLDFCRIVTRDARRTKFNLESRELMEHIKKTRYSKNYVIDYLGVKIYNID